MAENKEDIQIISDVAGLNRNLGIFNNEEKRAIKLLLDCNQSFIFEHWPNPGTDDEKKKALLAQVLRLNKQYPLGLVQYYKNGLNLIKSSFEGKNAYDGWTPVVPDGINLDFNSIDFNKYEALGKTVFNEVGFVLVAGGLGERLGYSGIKIALPIEITSNMTYIEYYIRFILTISPNAPLMIMTSNDTHAKTVELLSKNNNFGMNQYKDQLTLLKQELVPTFANNKCEFGLKNQYELYEKPHGHGDVHSLLYHSGLVRNIWFKTLGIKWMVFFQDTNGVIFRSFGAALGVSKQCNFVMNTIAVPRKPGQAIGGIAKLINNANKNKILTNNVEYNQLEPLLKSIGKTDSPDPKTGNSIFPGNTNSFIIRLDTYINIMDYSKGVIPEFVNPKYTDETRTKFKKPTRLECMMQDYPKLVSEYIEKNSQSLDIKNMSVGMTSVPAWLAMKPVKTNVNDSAKLVQKLGKFNDSSAATGEASMYYLNREILRTKYKESCKEAKEAEFAGIPVLYGARVVLYPSFGVTLKDVQDRLTGNISITERSTLIIEGDVIINGLKLDGTLIVRATNKSQIHINNLSVVNKGWEFKNVDINDHSRGQQIS